jgi:predicted dehydrogenase
MINVGIIGLGFMGTMHLKNYIENNQSKVIALCDLNKKRINGEELEAGNVEIGKGEIDFSKFKKYEKIDDIINDKDIDLIDICLSSNMNADVSERAMKAGKNVLCEKPMAMTLEEGRKMLAAYKAEKVLLMVAHCMRFWPEYIYLAETVQNKNLGALKSLFLSRLVAYPFYSTEGWLLDEKKSLGAIFNLHIHDVDYLVSLFGKPKNVVSQGVYEIGKGCSHVVTQYFYDDIPVVTALGGWMMPATFDFNMSYTAIFEKGTLIYNNSADTTLTMFTDEKKSKIENLPSGDGYSREIAYFLDCIKKGNKPELCMPESTFESLEVVFEELRYIKEQSFA